MVSIPSITTCRNLKNKRVLLRTDFDVPVDKSGKKIVDDLRIRANLPTLEFLLKKGAKIICVAKRGRPGGKREATLSMKLVVGRLQTYLPKHQIVLVNDLRKPGTMFKNQTNNQILVLENIRFYKEEEKGDPAFAKELASLADIYVNDNFSGAHRTDASITQVPKLLPSYGGLLLKKEIQGLDRVMKHPKKPFVLVLGGAKIETKVPIIKKLLPIASTLLWGGPLFTTYLSAQGYRIGNSLINKKYKAEAMRLKRNKKVVHPVDVIVGTIDGKKYRVVTIPKKPGVLCKTGERVLDIGPATIRLFATHIKKAKTLLWNGAVGYLEQKPYHTGSYAIARLIASRSTGKAYGVVGGGETLGALDAVGMKEQVDLVSTGGGAMLEYLAGKKLPAVEALTIRSHKR